MRPALLEAGAVGGFPNPNNFDDEGLVAIGGDLSGRRLVAAYQAGIFPWYSEGYPPLWWSPNPRTVLPLDGVHVSRSLRRKLNKHDFEVTWNQAFSHVIRACAEQRRGGTWILPDLVSAYENLHKLGHGHSLEVWVRSELVGGLYGVQVGGLFAAESMFHRASDMSKVALVYAAESLRSAGIRVFDVQFLTSHLASLGAREVPRKDYLESLSSECLVEVDLRDLKLLVPVDSQLEADHRAT
ncbi:MAG: hypothetical protein RJA70_1407 [Pseudomonadota bacterium]